MEPLFDKHVFVCLNNREKDPTSSCAGKNGQAVFDELKAKIKTLNLNKNVRINRAGCLGHCEKGLTLVIYPQAIWYQHVKIEDVDEIIEKSIVGDSPVARLLLQA